MVDEVLVLLCERFCYVYLSVAYTSSVTASRATFSLWRRLLRKDSGFEAMDRIKVAFSGNDTVATIAERNSAEIADETLADEIIVETTLANAKEWNINGETVTISVEKV